MWLQIRTSSSSALAWTGPISHCVLCLGGLSGDGDVVVVLMISTFKEASAKVVLQIDRLNRDENLFFHLIVKAE